MRQQDHVGGDLGEAAADQAAAIAVSTGLELCIDLADIGSPTGPIKVKNAVGAATSSTSFTVT